MFRRRLLLRFINRNKREKRNVLEENGIWQTTSELITISFARRSRYIFTVLREAIKSIQTGRRDIFRFFGAV